MVLLGADGFERALGLARTAASLSGGLLLSCNTAGSDWINQPLPGAQDPWSQRGDEQGEDPLPQAQVGAHISDAAPAAREGAVEPDLSGRVVGRFRNTYYDFPSEGDFQGARVAVMDANCKAIKQVPVEFHDALCVQGSGNLSTGVTVSFAKRDCECARNCPRTDQKICFEALSPDKFPWGRGALGKPITPLLTVAVDDAVLPMHTVLYIPEFDGLPRDTGQREFHDGCFIAQDRGLKVKGQHVDVFTGEKSVTEMWNRLVPSNQGVTVIVDAVRCARLSGSQK